jgi:hypothetical protein
MPGVKGGAPQTIRTSDLFLRREALYPAELGVPDYYEDPITTEACHPERILLTDLYYTFPF